MRMETTFVVTWVGAVLIGAALGVLTYWAFEKDNKKEEDHERQE